MESPKNYGTFSNNVDSYPQLKPNVSSKVGEFFNKKAEQLIDYLAEADLSDEHKRWPKPKYMDIYGYVPSWTTRF